MNPEPRAFVLTPIQAAIAEPAGGETKEPRGFIRPLSANPVAKLNIVGPSGVFSIVGDSALRTLIDAAKHALSGSPPAD